MRSGRTYQAAAVGSLAIVVGAAGLWLGTGAAEARNAMLAPQAVPFAVIEINTVLNKLEEKASREGELGGYLKQLGDALDATKKELDQSRADMNILPTNSPEFDQAREKVVRLTAKLRLDQEMSEALAADRRMRMQLGLFNKIRSATQRLAKKEGYGVVFSDDSGVEIPPQAPTEQIGQGIVTRRMIFADPAVNISEQVATMMNNEFKAAGGGSSEAKPK